MMLEFPCRFLPGLPEKARRYREDRAQELNTVLRPIGEGGGLHLCADADGLSLCRAGEKGAVRVDFTAGPARYRRLSGGGELLAKALKVSACRRIWDATGGLGRDAFVLASEGADVAVFERHPVVFMLLEDGLVRARACAETAEAAGRIVLQAGSITEPSVLQADRVLRPDAVYLDPMYPVRQKSAAVKKEMAFFHELLGAADPVEEAGLLDAARRLATKRVVVKRPSGGVFLASAAPDFSYFGKKVRFDVYLPYP